MFSWRKLTYPHSEKWLLATGLLVLILTTLSRPANGQTELSGVGANPSGGSIARVERCGTPAILENIRLVQEGRRNPGTLRAPFGPLSAKSVVSPKGLFTVYYQDSGADSTSDDYAAFIAATADEAYDLEITQLQYPKPPFTDADSTYRIEIRNLPSGQYGFTAPTTQLSNSRTGLRRSRAYISIDNNFLVTEGYATIGENGARITIFHEFNHVIQFGSWGYDPLQHDKFLEEMTSVFFEIRSTPDVKDYLQYLPAYFGAIDLSFDAIPNLGIYGQGIWMQYLSKRYGDDAVRKIWQNYSQVTSSPVGAIQLLLNEKQSNFCSEYLKFGSELFTTGKRYHGVSIFPDARQFPSDLLKLTAIAPINQPVSFQALPISLNYIVSGVGEDTSAVIVSRDTTPVVGNASVTVTGVGTYSTNFDDPKLYCDTAVGVQPTEALVFPQPFVVNSNTTDTLSILATSDPKQPVTLRLDIYSLSMAEVVHLEPKPVPYLNRYYANWTGLDDKGKPVPSGVYIYSIETDGKRRNGKVVVIRKG